MLVDKVDAIPIPKINVFIRQIKRVGIIKRITELMLKRTSSPNKGSAFL